MFRQYRTCIHSEFGKKSLFPIYQSFDPYSRQYFFKSILICLVKQLPSPFIVYIPFKSKMISKRQGEGNEAYYTYIEEADDAANAESALI
jgi:hypothetical protein